MAKSSPKYPLAVPKDFPRADLLDDVLFNYQICEELVHYLIDEVEKERLRSPLIPDEEIVEMHLKIARKHGWGCFPGEIEWIFQTVVRKLGCPFPDSLRP